MSSVERFSDELAEKAATFDAVMTKGLDTIRGIRVPDMAPSPIVISTIALISNLNVESMDIRVMQTAGDTPLSPSDFEIGDILLDDLSLSGLVKKKGGGFSNCCTMRMRLANGRNTVAIKIFRYALTYG